MPVFLLVLTLMASIVQADPEFIQLDPRDPRHNLFPKQ